MSTSSYRQNYQSMRNVPGAISMQHRTNILKKPPIHKLLHGGAVALWLTPQTPDPEVGGLSPIRVTVLCP